MDTPGDKELLNRAETSLIASQAARSKLQKREVVYYGKKPNTAGLLFINYASMVLNRNIDLFDDVMFMLNAKRMSSACILSRCVMETHAVGMYALVELGKYVRKQGAVGAGDKVLRFINSSRFKVEEQKSLKEGKFTVDDFHFTEEAKARMEGETAQSVHVLNAMRLLFSFEMEHTGLKESSFELTYNGLSEWVHPSQTSLMHRYATETQRIETSFGTISLDARMRFECAEGIKLIQQSESLRKDMMQLGIRLHELEGGIVHRE
ncbi:hypothetical protein ACQZ40_25450 [Agrobacterium sp. 16-172Ci]